MERKYKLSLSELLDRLTILQIKEVKNNKHQDIYKKEIQDIIHDIDLILTEGQVTLKGKDLRALVVLAQYNLHIWNFEDNARTGIKEGNDLMLTHSLNGVRSRAKNSIENSIGGRPDPKTDCLAAEFSKWEPSW